MEKLDDGFDLSATLPKPDVEGQVVIKAGPTEIRAVPITDHHRRTLIEAQKGRIMEFDHQATTLLAEATDLVVRDQVTNEQAVKIGALANKTIKDIEERVKEIVDPANTFVRDIRNFGKSLTAKLEAAKKTVSEKANNWRAIVEMERRKAQELADRARKEVQKDLDKQAEQLGVAAPQIEPAVIKKEPVITRTEFGTAYQRTFKRFRIVNPFELERKYLKPDEDAIQEDVESGIPIKGVEVYEETKTFFRR